MPTRSKTWVHFGGHPLPQPVKGILWMILQHCETARFSTIWIDILIGCSWKFYHKCSLEQGSLRYILEINRIRSCDPESSSIIRTLDTTPDPNQTRLGWGVRFLSGTLWLLFLLCFFAVISVVKECEYLIEKCYTSRSIGGKLFFYTALSCCVEVGCIYMHGDCAHA